MFFTNKAPTYSAPSHRRWIYECSIPYSSSQPMSYAVPKMHYATSSYAAPEKTYSVPIYLHSNYKRSTPYGSPAYGALAYSAANYADPPKNYAAPRTLYAS